MTMENAAAPGETKPTPTTAADLRAIIITSDPGLRRHLGRAIVAAGSKFFESSTGAAAIEAIMRTQDAFDIVFAEMQMQDMTAMDLVAVLKRAPLQAPPVVVALSGNSVAIAPAELAKAGFDEILKRPVFDYEIEQALMRVNERRQLFALRASLLNRPPS